MLSIVKTFLMSLALANAAWIFNPSIKLSSGKTISVVGKGPPLLFSTGLFGTMPRFFYSEFVNILKRNATVITSDGPSPIVKSDIDDIVNALRVDNIAYLSHSSFFPDVLESEYLNSAVLLDPINIPGVSFSGLQKFDIDLRMPTLIVKAEKLYNGKKTLPEWQDPNFKGEIEEEVFLNVGHPDILDNNWANIAKNIGLWEMADRELMNYKDWQFNSNSDITKIRENYRKYIAERVLYFINKCNQDTPVISAEIVS